MQDLLDIFLQPGPVLQKQYDRPAAWLPLAILAAATAVSSYLYFSKVDPVWFIQTALERSGQDLTPQQAEAIAASASPSASTLLWQNTIVAGVAVVAMQCLMGLYYMLVGKLLGPAVEFRQGLALAAWSAMPTLIGTLLGCYGTLDMTPQTFIDALSYTTLDPLLVQLPPESPWKEVAGSVSFLTLWTIGLAALGWKLWSRRSSWTVPIVVAALPYALYFGFKVMRAALA